MPLRTPVPLKEPLFLEGLTCRLFYLLAPLLPALLSVALRAIFHRRAFLPPESAPRVLFGPLSLDVSLFRQPAAF